MTPTKTIRPSEDKLRLDDLNEAILKTQLMINVKYQKLCEYSERLGSPNNTDNSLPGKIERTKKSLNKLWTQLYTMKEEALDLYPIVYLQKIRREE